MKRIQLREIAYARSGDKGDVSDIGLMAKDDAAYRIIKEKVTAQKVKEHFKDIVKGEVLRYEMDNLKSLEFVLRNALGGGATRTLAMDQTGKAYGQNLLRMYIEVED
jgi:phosphoribosylaminoimidazole-succinocarboxamide synthase